MSATPRVPNNIATQQYPALSNYETGITAGTTQTQAGATQLTAQINRVDTVGTTSDGVKLPKIVASPGRLGSVGSLVFVANAGASTMKLYGGTLDTVNGIATATGATVAAGVNVWLVAVTFNPTTGVGTWLMTNSQAAAIAAITSGTITGISQLTVTQQATIGTSASAIVAFYGAAGVSQAAALTSVVTSGVVTGGVGFATSAQATSAITAINSLILVLRNLGITV